MLLSISLDYEVFNFNDEYYINFILHVENYVCSLTMKSEVCMYCLYIKMEHKLNQIIFEFLLGVGI